MKKIILLLVLLGIGLFSNAQVVKTQYDSLQDRRMDIVQIKLKKFHDQYYRGVTLWYLGAVITAIAIPNTEGNGPGPLYAGLSLNFLGSIVMIASHRHVLNASNVGRTIPIEKYHIK